MEHFSYKDGLGVLGRHKCIETFKRELAWATDK